MATAYEQNAGLAEKTSGGGNAIKYVRKWKVVKSTRNESYDVPTLIGVNTGDQWPGGGEIYCTSLTDSPDGDSLMVRVITATYASPANTAGGGGGGGGGGSSQRQPGRDIGVSPLLRPAVVTFDASFEMTSTATWYDDPFNSDGHPVAMQPTGEIVDGVQQPQPITTITIAQYENDTKPTAASLAAVGSLNDADFSISGIVFPKRTLLLKGISARPVTEEWGGVTYKGINATYTLQARTNVQRILAAVNQNGLATSDGQVSADIGWDIAVPLRGLNCKQAVSPTYPTDPFALQLHRDENGIVFGDAQANPPNVGNGEGPIRCVINGAEKSVYWGGTKFVDIQGEQINFGQTVKGTIAKGMATSPTSEGGFAQSPSSQAIPLNPDGTPRARLDMVGGAEPGDADYLFRGTLKNPEDAVLSYRRGLYPDVAYSTTFAWKGITT